MGLVSPQQVTDGTSIDASDVNNPVNTITNEFNGNIDNSNIKTGAAIDGSKLAAGTVGNAQLAANAAWTSWSVVWTNLTPGNGVVTAKFYEIGKLVKARLHIIFGSTTTISGTVSFTLPVTSVTYPGTSGNYPIGIGNLSDSGAKQTVGYVMWLSTTTARPQYSSNDGSNFTRLDNVVNNTNPFGGGAAAGDEMYLAFEYEPA